MGASIVQSGTPSLPAVAEAGSDTGGSRRTVSGRSRSGPRWQSVGFGLPRAGGGREAAAGGWFVSARSGKLDPEVELRAFLGLLGLGLLYEINLGLSDIPIVGRMLLRQFTHEGFSPDSRVRRHSLVQCGTNISRSAGPHDSWRPRGCTTGSGGTALDLFCVGPLLGYPRGHTPC
ncbi:hypothetical protein EVAR_51426_1 [Eumeta japonica]|uniref:Uncharacterized protein n=1 Tax=Eumeta variegata TaxID=151549 RepID=A0A4C1XYS3_EUMVA|nr:hypothetical protein EVAR_51426_1 [Eumeta japonica]